MADYYPLLSRAIAGLAGQPASARHGIYERARMALERQLRGFEPALEEDAVQLELASLEATIARIESEQAPAALETETVQSEPATVETTPAVEQGAAKESPSEAPKAERAVAPLPPEEEAGLPAMSAEEKAEASTQAAPAAAPDKPNSDIASLTTSEPVPTNEKPVEVVAPTPRSPLMATRPTVNDLPPKEEMGLPLMPPSQLPDLPETADLPSPPEPDETLFAPLPPEPEAVIQPSLRPRMPSRRSEDKTPGGKPLAIFASIAVIAMMVMGAVALARRGTPERSATPPVIATPDATTDASKTEGRLSSVESASKPAEPRETPPVPKPDEAKPAQTTPAETKPSAPVASVMATNRAFMVLEVQGSSPNQFEGKTVWSFAPDPSLKGQRSLRAAITFPQAQMSIDFSIARNTDAAISASHTVMVVFETLIENVKEMSAVEWRERENQAGSLLAGIVVPIQENVFMIGLDKGEAAVARNMDLMRSQKWMVFEFRLVNGRRGAILIEKGATGEQAISDALANWK
ncbi:MAG: hypothetical protein CFE31_05605 [Rhizobiales bacterium PAR1]|nr:MAG: hypothetical protein CFE31_05605 [Rhizobiales bacterium PAR1]